MNFVPYIIGSLISSWQFVTFGMKSLWKFLNIFHGQFKNSYFRNILRIVSFALQSHFMSLICCWILCRKVISSQSLNLGGRRGTTEDVATIPFYPSLSSAALRESPNPIPAHSLMLSSHLFLCLPLLLAPFTVPCRIVFAMPEDLEMWPYHLCFRFFTMVRRSSCTPIAFWILLRTSSFVTWCL